MAIEDIWRAKTDEEVSEAVRQLGQYTSETQLVISAEFKRRQSRAREETLEKSIESRTLGAAQSLDDQPRDATRRASHSRDIPDRPHSTGVAVYRYKVVPFIGQNKGTVSADDVAQQLQRAIATYASEGWEFHQLSDVNIEVQPGCIAGMLGAKAQYVRFDQLIFRRPA